MFRKMIFSGIVLLLTIFSAQFSEGTDCQEAKTYFQQALCLKNNTPNLSRKELFYKRAIELCPTYVEAFNNLGDVYEKLGRFEEAIIAYKKAIELKRDAPYPYFGLGDIYYKTNRYEEAITWYQEGLVHNPNDTLTRERLRKAQDIVDAGVINAETLEGILSLTRGPGEVVSISFGGELIPFDFDQYEIKAEAETQLNEIGKALENILGKEYDNTMIEIAGHTDNRGEDEYNLELSRKRSESVIHYLVKNFSVPEERLKPVGHGERIALCTSNTEECYGLNRRVEVIRKPAVGSGDIGKTRTGTAAYTEPTVSMNIGVFYQESGSTQVKILHEGSQLQSRLDRYFMHFRPLQDCYMYILQEDSQGAIHVLFPKDLNDGFVHKDRDYWVPGFNQAYTLDDTTGEEKLYMLVTSWPPTAEIEAFSLEEQVKGIIKGLQTKALKVIRPSGGPEYLSVHEMKQQPQKIHALLERIEGEGGWMKIITFWHE